MPAVLITGASRGLGLEFARQYAADGRHVIATCRAPEKADALQKLAQQYSTVKLEKLDVGNQASIAALAEKLKETAIDVLINNAGLASGLTSSLAPAFGYDEKAQRFGTMDPEAWDKILRVNTIAPVMVAQAFFPHLRRAHGSKIIMLSSKMGSIELMSKSEDIAYRTSKTALNAAMRCLALTLMPEKIIAISFHPGWVKTDMGTKDAPLPPDESVFGMRKVIAGLTMKQSGQFLQYNGEQLPW
jgi:NAD(P)-dependent dehydrogenase (short-subunit alcohol dehydrogenase family)